MVRTTHAEALIERALAPLGLFLLGLTGWASERLPARTTVDAVFARLILACVAAVGGFIDGVSSPTNARSRPTATGPLPDRKRRETANR